MGQFQHPGRPVFQPATDAQQAQLWPTTCIQGTHGAFEGQGFEPGQALQARQKCPGKPLPTGLQRQLRNRGQLRQCIGHGRHLPLFHTQFQAAHSAKALDQTAIGLAQQQVGAELQGPDMGKISFQHRKITCGAQVKPEIKIGKRLLAALQPLPPACDQAVSGQAPYPLIQRPVSRRCPVLQGGTQGIQLPLAGGEKIEDLPVCLCARHVLAHKGFGLLVAQVGVNIAHPADQGRVDLRPCPAARQGIAYLAIEPLPAGPCAYRSHMQCARHLIAMGRGISSHCFVLRSALQAACMQPCLDGQALAVNTCQLRHIQPGQCPVQAPLLSVIPRQIVQFPGALACQAQARQVTGCGIPEDFPGSIPGQHREAATQPLKIRPAAVNSRAPRTVGTPARLPCGPELRQGVLQQRRHRQAVHMHPAQFLIRYPAHIANLHQYLVIKEAGFVPKPPQQGQALPLQGLLMAMAPGARMVVLEQWLVGAVVAGVPDPPGIELRIVDLFVEVPVYPHIGFALQPILAQGIGLNLRVERLGAPIGLKFRAPQAGLPVRQDDRYKPLAPARRCLRQTAADNVAGGPRHTGDGDIQGNGLHMGPGLLHIAHIPCFDAVADIHAHLQCHYGHHHLPGPRDKKRRHIQGIQTDAQVVLQALLQQLAVGIGRGHRQHAGIGLESGQVLAVEGREQLMGWRINADQRQLEINFVYIHRRHLAGRAWSGLVQMLIEPRHKSPGAALGYQAGDQLPTARIAQIQAQLILERLE